ncbi:MAG: TolC family protein [Brevinema sp.]
MKQILNILLWIVFFSSSLFAQEEADDISYIVLNEQEFLSRFLDNSYQKKALQYSFIANQQKVKIAFEPYMGSIFADASAGSGTTTNILPFHNIATNGTPVSTDFTTVNYTNLAISLGGDITVYPIGTYLKIQGGTSAYDIRSQTIDITTPNVNNININEYRDRYSRPYFNITLVQPWLKNGFAYNFHSRVIKISSNDTKIAQSKSLQELENIVFQALLEYHKLILQTKLIAIANQSLNDLKELFNTQRRLQRAGARASFDVQQIQLKIHDISSALAQEENTLELSLQLVEEQLGTPLNRSNLNLVDHSLSLENEYDVTNIYQHSLTRSRDLLQTELLLSNVGHSVRVLKNQRLPELNTIFSYETARSHYQDHPFLNRDNQPFSIPQDNFYAGLQFKMPLIPISAKARITEIIAQSNQVEYSKSYLVEKLQSVSRERYLEWHNNKMKVANRKENVEMNRAIVVEALRRYRISEMSVIDFFDYEENYRQNQLKLARDEFDYKISALAVELFQGTLLTNYGITLE